MNCQHIADFHLFQLIMSSLYCPWFIGSPASIFSFRFFPVGYHAWNICIVIVVLLPGDRMVVTVLCWVFLHHPLLWKDDGWLGFGSTFHVKWTSSRNFSMYWYMLKVTLPLLLVNCHASNNLEILLCFVSCVYFTNLSYIFEWCLQPHFCLNLIFLGCQALQFSNQLQTITCGILRFVCYLCDLLHTIT